ncbi:hypothetical protein [Catenuloplanes indicus]|uniref:Uncharacterized protein n=1 Tax=Catenuloplanes indicus TaxID=137267 RepID=A0AAE3VXV3_9ACTN|nr:hypothetical protein [Catenuloplanes indicus]MDQ0365204.1 hypothetical protein [Catenuloplanes indicus]
MSSFPAQSRRARDDTLAPVRRLRALRECALHFAPYGFHATWHHLIVSARIPEHLDDDPRSLTRAIDELQAARELVLPLRAAYAETRRREKAAGHRSPRRPVPPWDTPPMIGFAHCPDPWRHPAEPLPMVVRRIITHHAAGYDPAVRCLACGTERPSPHGACRTCGVGPFTPRRDPFADDPGRERWKRIWRRAFPRC